MTEKKRDKPRTGSATDLYVLHIIEAALAEHFGSPVFLTQYKIDYTDIRTVERKKDSSSPCPRPYTDAIRDVHTVVLFTSPAAPVAHRREGLVHNLPEAAVDILLTNETNGWCWNIERMQVSIRHWPEDRSDYFERYFYDRPFSQASDALRSLSKLLRDRGPQEMTNTV